MKKYKFSLHAPSAGSGHISPCFFLFSTFHYFNLYISSLHFSLFIHQFPQLPLPVSVPFPAFRLSLKRTQDTQYLIKTPLKKAFQQWQRQTEGKLIFRKSQPSRGENNNNRRVWGNNLYVVWMLDDGQRWLVKVVREASSLYFSFQIWLDIKGKCN